MTSPNDIPSRTRAWVDAGLIEQAQADAIVAHERQLAGSPAVASTTLGVSAKPEAKRDHLAGSLGTLGGLLVGLGVLLTVAANWDSISDTGKLLTIIVAMLVSYGIALMAEVRGAAQWVGTAGYTVGTLVFASGVFLLGQLYNVRAHDPLGFLVIAIVASILAVLSVRRMVGFIAAAAWIAWAVHEIVLSLADAPDDKTAAAVIGAGTLLGLAALAFGWILDGVAARAKAGSMAADLWVLGSPFRAVALLGLLAVLVPMSFAWHASEGQMQGSMPGGQLTITAAFALIGAVLVIMFSELRARRNTGIVLAISALLVLVAAVVFEPVTAGLIANVLLALGGLGLAWLGFSEDRRDLYSWGVAWIVVLIATRYIDVMVTSQLGGFGFIGAGLLLIGCAWLVGRSKRIWQERDA
ncbi:MAG: DUF2157 domain-containing protein [Gaiellales bacterium]